MTKEKTTLIQKDPLKGTAPNNYRLITCLPMMWKILTTQIREEMYYSLISRGLFPEEQKWCCKGNRRTKELLHIDQHILNESKTRRKNLAMDRVDSKKAYDIVPESWISYSIKMYEIPDKDIQFIAKNMEIWRVESMTEGKSLVEVKIKRGIFQGDAISPLLFVITMMPLKQIHRKFTAGYKPSKSQEKINHFMYMDDIKLLAKNERE